LIKEVLPTKEVQDLMDHGSIHSSIGGQFSFRIIGPCCRLYDREELPWPCCRLSWKGREPSWKRVGKRLVPDIAAEKCPSYAVEIMQPGERPAKIIFTLYSERLDSNLQEWWYSKRPRSRDSSNISPKLTLISTN
tara:strand:+ start:240 stop:644 length:405 start_codon:yes stop_codon:yes gene_type:complete